MKMMKSTGWYSGKTMYINPLAVNYISEHDGHAVIYIRCSDAECPDLDVKESAEEVTRLWEETMVFNCMQGTVM